MFDKRVLKGFQPGLYFSQNLMQVASDRLPARAEFLISKNGIFISDKADRFDEASNVDAWNMGQYAREYDILIRRYEIKLRKRREDFDVFTRMMISEEFKKLKGWK